MTTTTARQSSAGLSRNTTLPDEFRFFRRQTQPRIEAAAVVSAVVARLVTGPWAGGDAVVAVVLVAIQPFFEWVFHVYVLHYRPVQVLGRTLDFELARKHREHHVDPTVTELVFVPVRSLLWALAVVVALSFAFLPSVTTALTMIASVCTLLLAYEWTHYLIHSRYRPRTRTFRASGGRTACTTTRTSSTGSESPTRRRTSCCAPTRSRRRWRRRRRPGRWR